ncbi:MAG: hypothetical protein ACLSA6_18245 [Holdemania massiliensis]
MPGLISGFFEDLRGYLIQFGGHAQAPGGIGAISLNRWQAILPRWNLNPAGAGAAGVTGRFSNQFDRAA